MNYYLDTEFHEYQKQPRLLGINIGRPVPTIDLISIGIVAEDGREFYAVSNEFDADAAWHSHDIKGPDRTKVYWLRENVLKPIMLEFNQQYGHMVNHHHTGPELTLHNLKQWLKFYGKSRKQITEEIIHFVNPECLAMLRAGFSLGSEVNGPHNPNKQGWAQPTFYAYFADYDWVVFCQLFGKMIDLPKGFPMYCRDLKQTMDEKASRMNGRIDNVNQRLVSRDNTEEQMAYIKSHPDYPRQKNEHNALDDAKFNRELQIFLYRL